MNFQQAYIRPDQTILGIVGDFEPAKMKALISQTFGDWQPPATPAQVAIPPVTANAVSGVFLINQPQLTQSNILMGHLGGELNSPDYPALSVLNGVLSGMSGRLFNEVRSRQGLAYSVYGLWQANYDYPGLFVAGGQTRSQTTVPFVEALNKEIAKIRTTPITEEELKQAKESILNSFIFRFENPSQTLSRLLVYEYYGYPADFIFTYQQGVKKTTIEDVQQVAQKYLDPEKIVTLVVGNGEDIQPPLTSLNNQVKKVDITIPQPKS